MESEQNIARLMLNEIGRTVGLATDTVCSPASNFLDKRDSVSLLKRQMVRMVGLRARKTGSSRLLFQG